MKYHPVGQHGASRTLELQPLDSKGTRSDDADRLHDPQDPEYGSMTRKRGRWPSFLAYLHHEGGWITASAHIITAIIGAGVLGLPNAFAWLGWPAGVVLLVVFVVIALGSSLMLTDVYEVGGRKHPTYRDAVLSVLGPAHGNTIAVVQYTNLVLCGIGYTVAAAQSIKAVLDTRCASIDKGGDPSDSPECSGPLLQAAIGFGASQLLVSQLPSLEEAWWSSVVGATMSILYSSCALGLSLANASSDRASTTGRSAPAGEKAFGVFNALGSIAFAYNFQTVLLEVQHTLHEPPNTVASMRKAISASLGCSFAFYLAVGVAGYAALGDAVPGDILTGFSGPAWVVGAANIMVLVHMVSAYQVFSQPVFHAIEMALSDHTQWAPRAPAWVLRLVVRTPYVAFTTLIACLMPFFSDIIGLIGALVFWPACVFYPAAMWVQVHQPARWARRSLTCVSWACLAISALAFVGAVQNIVVDVGGYALLGG